MQFIKRLFKVVLIMVLLAISLLAIAMLTGVLSTVFDIGDNIAFGIPLVVVSGGWGIFFVRRSIRNKAQQKAVMDAFHAESTRQIPVSEIKLKKCDDNEGEFCSLCSEELKRGACQFEWPDNDDSDMFLVCSKCSQEIKAAKKTSPELALEFDRY